MTFHNSKSTTARSGLSVIEVLTSMVVALIGVAGVMILIPFAVKQAELGLDIDDANRLGRNAVSQFEIGEHNRLIDGVSVWIEDTANTRVSTPEAYAIDPMMIVMDGGLPLAGPAFPALDQFPPVTSIINAGFEPDATVPDHFPRIANVNLAHHDPTTIPATFTAYNESSARRMFLTSDDLQFGKAADDLTGPRQVYDVNAGANVRRQSRGEMSWMSIVNPVKDDYFSVAPIGGTLAWKFQQQILVFKNRVFSDTAMVMPIAEVKAERVALNPTIVYSGGTITVFAEVEGIRKNDWIMLVNEDPRLEAGFQKQISFYRVIGYGLYDSGNNETQITLDGPDFNLRNEITRTTAPGTDPATDWVRTYAVHLANFDAQALARGKLDRKGYVVNVYERTFRLEEKSIWNE